ENGHHSCDCFLIGLICLISPRRKPRGQLLAILGLSLGRSRESSDEVSTMKNEQNQIKTKPGVYID
ncbi:hypothetical protein OAG73_00765, partial [bacterium]|nr:hypothetical protein [bacterium]